MSIKDMLGIWSDGRGPLYVQLADALVDAIDRGDLPPHTKLPPERQLSSMLAVSRTTVIAAFEVLRQQGLLERRQGSGTWVARRSRRLDVYIPDRPSPSSYGLNRVVRASTRPVPDLVDLSSAAFSDVGPLAELMSTFSLSDLTGELGAGYLPAGHRSLRGAVAEHLSGLGVPTTASQILITTGAQQATDLIFALFAPDGGSIIIENPTWTGVLDVARARAARLLTVPVDERGVRTDALLERARGSNPRLAWLTSGYHNPTGVRLGEERAAQVARIAAQQEFLVVEDLSLYDLSLTEPPAPPIAHFSPNGPVITVGSLSKTLWPGLRLGWIRASEQAVIRLARQKAVRDNGTPQLDQVLAARLLASLPDVAAERSDFVRGVRDAVTGFLARELPEWRFTEPAGGLSLWVQLPAGDAYELAQVAQRHLVEFVPGEAFSPDSSHAQFLRLPLAHPIEETLRGLTRLAQAWNSYAEGGRHPAER